MYWTWILYACISWWLPDLLSSFLWTWRDHVPRHVGSNYWMCNYRWLLCSHWHWMLKKCWICKFWYISISWPTNLDNFIIFNFFFLYKIINDKLNEILLGIIFWININSSIVFGSFLYTIVLQKAFSFYFFLQLKFLSLNCPIISKS